MVDKRVVVYSTSTCHYCAKAKDYLSQKRISFVEHNVVDDKNAIKEMMKKSGQMGVPVMLVDDEVIVGFDQAKLDKLLLQ
jgi:glutaredoxin-like YruB-family protein